jgi:urease accessory protein
MPDEAIASRRGPGHRGGPAPRFAAGALLADARFPAGGHAHSGGVEPACSSGAVADAASLELFLRGRLRTSGVTAAGLAAAACDPRADWAALDAEADARMPSPAQRDASRRQGRAVLRAARAAWPAAAYLAELGAAPPLFASSPPAAAAAGCVPGQAAHIAAYQSVSGPAGAAVRLLGLDPIAVNAIVARIVREIDDIAWEGIPFPSAPNLDLLAEAHMTAEARLFES